MAEGKRVYHSPLRAEQALRTRAAVLDAAGRCFLAQGYAATTMKDVAAAAGVSVQTVFGQGSKAALLLACVDRAVVGDDEQAPMAQRALFTRVVEAPDRAATLAAAREMALGLIPVSIPMLRVFAAAAAGDAEIGEAWAEYERRRLQDARLLVGAFEPWFRDGLQVDRATEIFWGVFSHVPADNLVRVCGWSVEEYVDFLIDAVERVLLT